MAKNRQARRAARGELPRPIRAATVVEDVGWRELVGSGLKGVAAAERSLREAVADARHQGASWSEVGAVLGCSRQAAHERFGTVRNR